MEGTKSPGKTDVISRRSALAAGLVATVVPAAIGKAQMRVPQPASAKIPVLKTAWDRYAATMEDLRNKLEQSEQFASAPDQCGIAYHALLEAQAIAYNFAMAPQLTYPRLFHNTSWQTEIYTLGGNGPDFDYHTVFLDGTQTYRLKGKANDSQLLLAQLNRTLPGCPGARLLANYDFSSFSIAKDGSFEIILSAEKHDGNWIKLDVSSGYQWMLFRPTVETWDAVPAALSIERISGPSPDQYRGDAYDPAAIARQIDMAADYARYMIEEWTIAFTPRVRHNANGTNLFATIGTEISGEVGSPTARYVMADYEVGDDEALIVELPEDPGGAYWSFQIFDVWLRSIDFRTHQSALNRRQINKDADGRIRIILSRQDPGVANWLDTVGFGKGIILLRNYRSPKAVVPTMRRVKFSELDRQLPKGTLRITPAQRLEELERRRTAYLHRHGE